MGRGIQNESSRNSWYEAEGVYERSGDGLSASRVAEARLFLYSCWAGWQKLGGLKEFIIEVKVYSKVEPRSEKKKVLLIHTVTKSILYLAFRDLTYFIPGHLKMLKAYLGYWYFFHHTATFSLGLTLYFFPLWKKSCRTRNNHWQRTQGSKEPECCCSCLARLQL